MRSSLAGVTTSNLLVRKAPCSLSQRPLKLRVQMEDQMRSDDTWVVFERLQGRVAAQIRALLAEPPYEQDMFDEEQKARRIRAMQEAASDPSQPEEQRHALWVEQHKQGGWVYGPEFDPKAKQHPNLVEWNQLPRDAKVKIRIFRIIAEAAKEIATRDAEVEELLSGNYI